jgi:hypothetical protein
MMARKSKGLLEAINDLVVRKRKGGTKGRTTQPKPSPMPVIKPAKATKGLFGITKKVKKK